MNVLHVIPSVSERHGGPTYALHAFARAVEKQGANVFIATTDDDGDNRRLDVPLGEFVERRGLKHIFFRRDLLRYKVSIGLGRWLKHNIRNFDVVHIHALFSYSSGVASGAARKNGVPYIIRPLGVLNRWGMENRRPLLKRFSLRFVELPILRHAAAIHYTTEAEKTEAVTLRDEISAFPPAIIPIPVDPPAQVADNQAFIHAFPQTVGRKIILFLSRLDRKKGIEILLESVAIAKTTEPHLVLVLAGDGEETYVENLKHRTEALGLNGNVLWPGHLRGEQKAAAFAAASMFVLPSHSENFGIAAAEALAAGVPTIISDQVALAEYTATRNAAVVVRTDPKEIAAAIVRLLNDPPFARQCADNGRRLVEQFFSAEAVGAALMRLYRQLSQDSSATMTSS